MTRWWTPWTPGASAGASGGRCRPPWRTRSVRRPELAANSGRHGPGGTPDRRRPRRTRRGSARGDVGDRATTRRPDDGPRTSRVHHSPRARSLLLRRISAGGGPGLGDHVSLHRVAGLPVHLRVDGDHTLHLDGQGGPQAIGPRAQTGQHDAPVSELPEHADDLSHLSDAVLVVRSARGVATIWALAPTGEVDPHGREAGQRQLPGVSTHARPGPTWGSEPKLSHTTVPRESPEDRVRIPTSPCWPRCTTSSSTVPPCQPRVATTGVSAADAAARRRPARSSGRSRRRCHWPRSRTRWADRVRGPFPRRRCVRLDPQGAKPLEQRGARRFIVAVDDQHLRCRAVGQCGEVDRPEVGQGLRREHRPGLHDTPGTLGRARYLGTGNPSSFSSLT